MKQANDIEPEPKRWHLMTTWLATAGDTQPPEPSERLGRGWHRRDDRPPASAAENMLALLVLIAAANNTGDRVSTAAAQKSRCGIVRLRGEADYPRLPHPAVLALLHAAEAGGLLDRRPHRDVKGILREHWHVTQAGRMHIDAAAQGGRE